MNNTFRSAEYAAARTAHQINPARSGERSPKWLSSAGPLSPQEER